MAQTLVTPETMITLANGVEEKIADWNQAVTKIYQLAQEMDAMWDGTANDAFNTRFDEDRTKFEQLSTIMSEYATAIKTAAQNYMTTEEEVTSIVQRS